MYSISYISCMVSSITQIITKYLFLPPFHCFTGMQLALPINQLPRMNGLARMPPHGFSLDAIVTSL